MTDPIDWMNGGWMQTFTGRQFSPADPKPEQIDVRDIARALSMTCRYGGHVDRFYSVAEHCVRLAMYFRYDAQAYPDLRDRITLAQFALMHDAAEAYLTDIPYPVKALLPDFKALEAKVMDVIERLFGLDVVSEADRAKVKLADRMIALTEITHVLGPLPPGCVMPVERLRPGAWSQGDFAKWGLKPKDAERAFLASYDFYFRGE